MRDTLHYPTSLFVQKLPFQNQLIKKFLKIAVHEVIKSENSLCGFIPETNNKDIP